MEQSIKTILVIGNRGMAGHVIFRYFKQFGSYKVFGLARNIVPAEDEFNLDVYNTNELQKIIDYNCFDYIVNCIGILNKDAEDNPDKAIWYNSYFPHFLEKITKNNISKVIHISTDCVFNGKRGNYTDDDFKDGVGYYAQSKALGEIINSKDVTIRTSIIGPELNKNGIGLFNWFMNQKEEANLKGFSRAFWSGITTLELAEVIAEVIKQEITGLIQVAPKEKIDKYNLLLLFNKIYRQNKMRIDKYEDYAVDKSLRSIRTDFNYHVKSYSEMLLLQKDWIAKNKDIYQLYL
ncbi:dTDP-4-dehydrorhamnose reductase family protein [Polluticaenibacter yanchengensis]|uniref:dTDP-4-dehydrorhamnose reductase n=1 Tax=Polluticaenibacter yanchengensis TaxID=3014562 RepID=A0ABT4UNJ8_9BACT|nr:SDR family oxidoreductase [Chitinophagaceae bacterium LY-5]